MNQAPTSLRGAFLRSPHHVWLGLATLGASFMTGEPFLLLVGAAAYALGWIYVPDTGFFKRYVERKQQAAAAAAAQAELDAFNQRREALLNSLTPSRRARYGDLAGICRDIEKATQDDSMTAANPGADPRLRKLDDLMWAYLRMLNIEETLETHLELERRDNLAQTVSDGEAELKQLAQEFEALKKQGASVFTLDTKEKLINSRLERLEVLRSRQGKMEEVQTKLRLVLSEQDRLQQQIKLIRTEILASKNTDTLSTRIDASFAHLAETNRWLNEMEAFKDQVGPLPDTPQRVGYAAPAPSRVPPPLQPAAARPRTAQPQRNPRQA